MRWAAALADERDLPAGAADAVMGQRRGRCASEPPAGERGRGLRQRIGARTAPAPEQQGRSPAFLGGELEPPARGHRQPPDLADHSREAAVANPLLDHRQHLLVIAAFGIDEAIGSQPRLGEAGREQIAAGKSPEHLPGCAARHCEAGGERGEKQGGCGLVIGRGRRRGRFVQAQGEAVSRQPFVHLGDAEGKA